MSSAAIAGVYEHPTRDAPDTSVTELHAEITAETLDDAGLTIDDVDAYFTAGDPAGMFSVLSMIDYLGLEDLSHIEGTDIGGSSYVSHLGHAASAIEAGDCEVALLTMAGRPRNSSSPPENKTPEAGFEDLYGLSAPATYALAARRHMHEFGTTSEQLAEVRVAASHHAQYNENAMFQEPVTVDDVVESPLVCDPLHLLDCCVVSDGGGGILVVSDERAAELERKCIPVLGCGEAVKHPHGGAVDLTYTAAVDSGPRAFSEADVDHDDIDYASIYDSFTITVVETLEDLGFCEKGDGGSFVEGGTLKAPDGDLPYNTDGGGLCNNHPGNRGGMTKVIEAVRQLRGEAAPELQVPDCETALVHGTGGSIGTRMGSVTAILGRETV
ncbi:thiolase domain-containing protein [Halobellus salinisoli]|uniref:thiolase domain-containing protein n=1 Tax=Halobellus salinisoli TaxID=3108500 RepID=UPI0030090947